MLKVEDVMTRKVLTIDPHADVRDAAWGLSMKGVSGAPVKDEHGNLIGVLSKSDLSDPARMHGDSMSQTVEDTMTPFLFTAKASDPVRFAVRRMVETGSHRLVVLDDDGKLVGIVTPMDVMRAMDTGEMTAEDLA